MYTDVEDVHHTHREAKYAISTIFTRRGHPESVPSGSYLIMRLVGIVTPRNNDVKS